MIKINLLPQELRPRKKTTLPLKAMSLIGAGIVAVLIISYIAVGVKIAQQKRKLNLLKAEYQKLLPEFERVKKLKDDKERLDAKVALMERLIVQRFIWAKKLNQLSDLMPPQVWLTSLSVATNKAVQKAGGKDVEVVTRTLLIRGKTYSGLGEKMVGQQGDFVRRIKEHEPFFRDFSNVEWISTERETIGNAEIMKFELTCQFK